MVGDHIPTKLTSVEFVPGPVTVSWLFFQFWVIWYFLPFFLQLLFGRLWKGLYSFFFCHRVP